MSESVPAQTRVVIVEDHTDYRGFLRTTVDGIEGFRCVGDFGSVEQAMTVIGDLSPDLLLLDLVLPGIPGEQSIGEFLRRVPRLEIVVLTFFGEAHRLFSSLEAGAVGYLTKPIEAPELVAALQEVRAGGAPMSGPIARMVLRSFRTRGAANQDLEALTSREREILRHIAGGAVPKEVAASLGIALRTVQTHLRNIYDKLHVHSRSQAVSRFLEARRSG